MSGGSTSVTTTLKSFASWLEVVDWELARPVERMMALLPISVTLPLKVLLGMASIVTSADCPMRTFTMSVSSTLTSEVITDMSAMVISRLPGEFWMPITMFSPMCTGRLVTIPSRGAAKLNLFSTSFRRVSVAPYCPRRVRAVCSCDLACSSWARVCTTRASACSTTALATS